MDHRSNQFETRQSRKQLVLPSFPSIKVDILPNGQVQVLFGASSSVLQPGDVVFPGTTIIGSISLSQGEPVKDQNQSPAENKEKNVAAVALSLAPVIPEGKEAEVTPSDFEDEFVYDEEDGGEFYEEEEDADFVMEENPMEVEFAPVIEKQGYIFPAEINYETVQDVQFTDAEFEAFLGEPLMSEPHPTSPIYTSAQSNHSAPSSSSMMVKMDKLVVHHSEVSNSHSGKRKENDGTMDTASSVPLGTKKPMFGKE